MSIIKKLLPNILTGKSNSKKPTENGSVGRLEMDAQRMDDEDNESSNNYNNNNINSNPISPTVSTELSESVVRELSNPNYDSSTGAVIEQRERPVVNNAMNVQHQEQKVVMNFNNASNLHFGSVYNFNGNLTASGPKTSDNDFEPLKGSASGSVRRQDGKPRKTPSILAMMQSQEEPNHRILDTIATHLGEGWKEIMRDLGHSEGQIEQAIIDNQIHGGLKEVIYQLLLQWIRGADDNAATLGFITTLLWESNQRECVQRMKVVWKAETNRKRSS